MYYFTNNDILSKYQFGLTKVRSTVLQLLNLLDSWTKHLDTHQTIDVVYTDFEKAFNKVPHKSLIFKLKKIWHNSKTLTGIIDYLNTRKLKVTINNNYSTLLRM